jgi:4-amino-4-deoxy-L-arabinose transferase-like glycosyltransferase
MEQRRISRIELLVLLAIILLAAFLRLYRIDALPPGDGYDPAYYGIDAVQILQGDWPLFLPTNFGREVLFSYLVAISVAVFGISPLAIHVASAVVGILTVPAVYLVGREILAEEKGALGRYGGLLAALAVAISYWHLNWSRYGVRAILLPLFASITITFLWRGFRTGSRWHFVASGIFLGLGMYTYQAARILPLLVIFGFAYMVAWRRMPLRRALESLLVVAVVALLIFAPLGIYFLTHPGSFSQRIEQTLVLDTAQDLQGNVEASWEQVLKVFLVLFVQGDNYAIHNLIGRPALNGFLAFLLVLGAVVSLVRIKRPAYPFLLTWLIVMSIPAVLAGRGPIGKRAIGTLPAVMILIAIGTLVPWETVSRWAAARIPAWSKPVRALLAAILVLGFLFTAILTYRDYFVIWAGDPDLFTHFEVGLASIGQYARSLPPEEEVYVSPVPPTHPSVVYNSQNRPGIKGYDGRFCIVVPEQTLRDTTYIIIQNYDRNSLDLLHAIFPQGQISAEGPLHYGQPWFLAFGVPADNTASISPSHPLKVNWDNRIKLLGFDLESKIYEPGDTIHLTLYYQALTDIDENFTVFTQLLGPTNPATGTPLWGQSDSEPCQRAYPTSTWQPGEIIRDQFEILIGDGAPTGQYPLLVGFYLLETMERLPATDAAGNRLPDNAVQLGTIQIGR